VKDVYRHLFFDKVSLCALTSCLYEIPKNDLVDDVKLWPPVTSPDVYCYFIETPDTSLGKSWKHTTWWLPGGSSHYRCWSAIL